MSVLKITDPAKRDFSVYQLRDTCKAIREDSKKERVGDIQTQQSLTKFYKPLTQKIEPTIAAIAAIPESIKAITFPQYPAILPPLEDSASAPLLVIPSDSSIPAEASSMMEIGEIVTTYLKKFAYKSDDTDKVFGMHNHGGKFFIESTEVKMDGDKITLLGNVPKTFTGSNGLWELLVSKQPSSEIYSSQDLENYEEIMVSTNALKRDNDPNETHTKANRSYKWMNVLKPIWEKYHKKGTKLLASKSTGKGLTSIFLPSDPNALLQRLDLLLASKQASNTGVQNEAVTICDELKRLGQV